jgi:hypothetical protein
MSDIGSAGRGGAATGGGATQQPPAPLAGRTAEVNQGIDIIEMIANGRATPAQRESFAARMRADFGFQKQASDRQARYRRQGAVERADKLLRDMNLALGKDYNPFLATPHRFGLTLEQALAFSAATPSTEILQSQVEEGGFLIPDDEQLVFIHAVATDRNSFEKKRQLHAQLNGSRLFREKLLDMQERYALRGGMYSVLLLQLRVAIEVASGTSFLQSPPERWHPILREPLIRGSDRLRAELQAERGGRPHLFQPSVQRTVQAGGTLPGWHAASNGNRDQTSGWVLAPIYPGMQTQAHLLQRRTALPPPQDVVTSGVRGSTQAAARGSAAAQSTFRNGGSSQATASTPTTTARSGSAPPVRTTPPQPTTASGSPPGALHISCQATLASKGAAEAAAPRSDALPTDSIASMSISGGLTGQASSPHRSATSSSTSSPRSGGTDSPKQTGGRNGGKPEDRPKVDPDR